MITRSKLVEQLRDYQIRSQHKWPALTVFSPKPILSTREQRFPFLGSPFCKLIIIDLLTANIDELNMNLGKYQASDMANKSLWILQKQKNYFVFPRLAETGATQEQICSISCPEKSS